MPKREHYQIEGDKLVRTRKHCPKCGEGVFLAEHKDRTSCGSCSYTEFKKQKVDPAQDEKKPAAPREDKSPKDEKPEEEPKVDEPADEKLLEGIPKDGLSAEPAEEEESAAEEE